MRLTVSQNECRMWQEVGSSSGAHLLGSGVPKGQSKYCIKLTKDFRSPVPRRRWRQLPLSSLWQAPCRHPCRRLFRFLVKQQVKHQTRHEVPP